MSSASDFTRVCLQIRTTREGPSSGEIASSHRASMGRTSAETGTDRKVSLCIFRGDRSGFIEVLTEEFGSRPVKRSVSARHQGNDAPSRIRRQVTNLPGPCVGEGKHLGFFVPDMPRRHSTL